MEKSQIDRFFRNESSDSERKLVLQWLLNPAHDTIMCEWMYENWGLICKLEQKDLPEGPDTEKLWLVIQQKVFENESVQQNNNALIRRINAIGKRFRGLSAAAAILMLILAGISYLLIKSLSHDSVSTRSVAHTRNLSKDVIAPQHERAQLTLADGKTIYLDSAGTGTLATQGSVNVKRTANGEIIYSGSPTDIVSFNTLRVPKGSKPVRLLLADGSLVWLNASSSITFPTAFKGNERKVSMTGEVYFEVAKNREMPFLVNSGDATIKVYGTHFNVNSYSDEATARVTLLEGSVKVQLNDKSEMIRPGQQARLSASAISVVNDVEIEEVMAWKNGQFFFTGSDIKTIMRQLEKYYDVEVVYQDEVKYRFVAKISREGNISELLKKLELTNLIHFKIEGKKVTVMK